MPRESVQLLAVQKPSTGFRPGAAPLLEEKRDICSPAPIPEFRRPRRRHRPGLRAALATDDDLAFLMTAQPTELQARAFKLIGIEPGVRVYSKMTGEN